jgi:hypothetical protein
MRELWIYSKLELFFIMPYSAKKKGVEEDSVVGKVDTEAAGCAHGVAPGRQEKQA